MSDKAFIDTNVFVYLYSMDEHEKRERALAAISEFECVTSTQALNEFSNVCTKKWKLPVADILQAIDEIIEACKIMMVDEAVIKKALHLHGELGYSYYDGLMLASALANDCAYILTEDMAGGQTIDKTLKIKNIFA